MNRKLFGLICSGLYISASVNADAPLKTQENEIPPTQDISDYPTEDEQENPKSQKITSQALTSSFFLFPFRKKPRSQRPHKATSQPLTSIELGAAAFFPMSNRFRKIYGTAGLSLQAEVGMTFPDLRNIGVWINGEWISMKGKPIRSCGSTGIDIFNMGFGVKGIGHFFNDVLFLYGGIGPGVGLVYIENKLRCSSHCPTKKEHRSRAAVGVTLKTGAEVYFTHNLYFSLFGDYLYLPVGFSRTVDAGGFKVGGGFGARF